MPESPILNSAAEVASLYVLEDAEPWERIDDAIEDIRRLGDEMSATCDPMGLAFIDGAATCLGGARDLLVEIAEPVPAPVSRRRCRR